MSGVLAVLSGSDRLGRSEGAGLRVGLRARGASPFWESSRADPKETPALIIFSEFRESRGSTVDGGSKRRQILKVLNEQKEASPLLT